MPGTTSQRVPLPSPGIKSCLWKWVTSSELHCSLHCKSTALTRYSQHFMEMNCFTLKHFLDVRLQKGGCSLLEEQQSEALLGELRSCPGKCQPAKGLTSQNTCNNFVKCQIWKRTITMSTYSPRLTFSQVLFQQGLLMFCHTQGRAIKSAAALGGCFMSSFSAHWQGSWAEVQVTLHSSVSTATPPPPCAAEL